MLAGRSLPATCAQKEKGVKDKANDTKQFVKGNVAQILGIRGGDQETNIWKIRLQLTKPVTWIPLIWGMPNSTDKHSNFLRRVMHHNGHFSTQLSPAAKPEH